MSRHLLAAAALYKHSPQQLASPPRKREGMPQARRTANALGPELRGETGPAALSSPEPTSQSTSPPLSPVREVNCPTSTAHTDLGVAQFPEQGLPPPLQTPQSPVLHPPLEKLHLPEWVGEPSNRHPCHACPIRHQSDSQQSCLQLHLPFLPSPCRPSFHPRARALKPQRIHILWQRPARLPLRGLLHRRPHLRPRVPHAAPRPPQMGHPLRHAHARPAEPPHGTSLHGPLLCCVWPARCLHHERHSRLVFQYGRHVRHLSAP